MEEEDLTTQNPNLEKEISKRAEAIMALYIEMLKEKDLTPPKIIRLAERSRRDAVDQINKRLQLEKNATIATQSQELNSTIIPSAENDDLSQKDSSLTGSSDNWGSDFAIQ